MENNKFSWMEIVQDDEKEHALSKFCSDFTEANSQTWVELWENEAEDAVENFH